MVLLSVMKLAGWFSITKAGDSGPVTVHAVTQLSGLVLFWPGPWAGSAHSGMVGERCNPPSFGHLRVVQVVRRA
jgi:hypothetical protein